MTNLDPGSGVQLVEDPDEIEVLSDESLEVSVHPVI